MPTPIVLASTVTVEVDAPVAPSSLTIEPLPIVAQAVQSPTLTDGRPQ